MIEEQVRRKGKDRRKKKKKKKENETGRKEQTLKRGKREMGRKVSRRDTKC